MAMTKELRDRLQAVINGFGKFQTKLGGIKDTSLATELKGLVDEVKTLLRSWRGDTPKTEESAQGVSKTEHQQALASLQLLRNGYLESIRNTLSLLSQQVGLSKTLCVERSELAKIDLRLKQPQYSRFSVREVAHSVYTEMKIWRNLQFLNRVLLLPVCANQETLDLQFHADRRIFEITLLTLLKFLHVHSPHEKSVRLYLNIKKDELVVGGITSRDVEMGKRRVGFFDPDKPLREQECGFAFLLRLALIFDLQGLRFSKIQEEKKKAGMNSMLYFTIPIGK